LFNPLVQADLKQDKELVSVERCPPKTECSPIINLFLLLYITSTPFSTSLRGLLEKYPTFGREKETGLLGALDT
jgi:hypothetical protein